MTLYLRQVNEALDEDQKVLRQQLGLYKKQVDIWNKSKEEDEGTPGIETLTKSDYFKFKILISNFSEAVNQVVQNWNKGDFAGVGTLQKTYEALARFVKDVITGNYLTADKERVLGLLKPVISSLRGVNALADESAFSASEKILVNTILNNIVEKNFEPIGFLPIPTEEERTAEKQRRQKPTVNSTEQKYITLRENIAGKVAETPAGERKQAFIKLRDKLRNNTKQGKISQKMYSEVLDAFITLTGEAEEEVQPGDGFVGEDEPGYAEIVETIMPYRENENLPERLRNKAEEIYDFINQNTINGVIAAREFDTARKATDKLKKDVAAALKTPPRTRGRSRTPQLQQEGEAA